MSFTCTTLTRTTSSVTLMKYRPSSLRPTLIWSTAPNAWPRGTGSGLTMISELFGLTEGGRLALLCLWGCIVAVVFSRY